MDTENIVPGPDTSVSKDLDGNGNLSNNRVATEITPDVKANHAVVHLCSCVFILNCLAIQMKTHKLYQSFTLIYSVLLFIGNTFNSIPTRAYRTSRTTGSRFIFRRLLFSCRSLLGWRFSGS